jgi:long-chain acyl-CoA synthetase
VAKLLGDSGAVLLVCDQEHFEIGSEAVSNTGVAIVLTDSGVRAQAPLVPESTIGLDSIFAQHRAGFQAVARGPEDVASLLYTSGTTADPKGVMLTHANLLAEAEAVFAWAHIGPDDAILGVLPLFHVLSQMANLLLPLVSGASAVFLSTLNTTELLRALRERKITAFAVVPQFFYLIHERIFK